MRAIFFALIAAATTFSLQAQDAEKDMKKAGRDISSYRLDPSANADKLEEAITLIGNAVADPEVSKQSKTWQVYGEVYTEVMNNEVRKLATDQEAPIDNPMAAAQTVKGYMKAHELAEKGFEEKDALKGLSTNLNNVSFMASVMLRNGDYANAYTAYKALVDGNDYLIANGEQSIYENEEDLQQQMYWGALAAYSAEKYNEAEQFFTRLLDEEYDSPDIYSAMFDMKNKQGEEEAALVLLREGIAKYPDDKGLMFAEINYALSQGDLDALVDKLQKAMEAEPENITIPTTLGNVYDQLYQRELKEGNKEKATEYYEEAKKYFAKALALDDSFFDAVYMMGAVEYNRAAEFAEEVNSLADDYSKEGTARYEKAKTDMLAQFDSALPYFLKAEQLNPQDRNTLIALREIYARKDQLEKSNEYKEKLESLDQ